MILAPFIVIDGLDGTGKSTQCRLLLEWLHFKNIMAIHTHDPGGTPLGERLRSILLDLKQDDVSLKTEAMMFMSSRAELVEKILRPSLQNGVVVISDRFLLANVVYQGHAGGLDPAELWNIGRFTTGGIEPDLTFVLDLPVEQAIARRGRSADRMEARDRAYQERVREGFLLEAAERPDSIQVIDASAPVQDIQRALRFWVGGLLRLRGFPLPPEGAS
jgi:dTMP kinase